MEEDMEKLFDLKGIERRKALKIPAPRPPYSYTSICPDEKFKIAKKPVKLSTKK